MQRVRQMLVFSSQRTFASYLRGSGTKIHTNPSVMYACDARDHRQLNPLAFFCIQIWIFIGDLYQKVFLTVSGKCGNNVAQAEHLTT